MYNLPQGQEVSTLNPNGFGSDFEAQCHAVLVTCTPLCPFWIQLNDSGTSFCVFMCCQGTSCRWLNHPSKKWGS